MVGIAQLVEQRTENPRVTSSNLVPGTYLIWRSIYSINEIDIDNLIDMDRHTYSLIV